MRLFYYMGFIFGAMNFYIFWRMRSAFGPGKWQWAALLFLAAMVYLFTQRRAVVGTAWEETVHTIALVWMGIVLITITWLLFLDAARFAAWAIDSLAGTKLLHVLRLSRSVPAVLALCLLLSLYAFFEALNIRTAHLAFPTAKLPENIPRLRLVVMSDVHINALTGERRLSRMVKAAKEADADLLLMLGDFVDTDMRGREKEAAMFREIPAKLGKYAILGNHEAYSGLQNSLDFTRAAGFHILRNEATHAGGIAIAGVDDAMFLAGRVKDSAAIEENAALTLLRSLQSEHTNGRFVLLLRHRPGLHQKIAGLFDLQLSGHTHGGQIWPARFLAERANGIASGLATIHGQHGNSAIYVTPGTGVWGPPMRLFTPPEVTVIDLIRQS